jgi:hypothetical protein
MTLTPPSDDIYRLGQRLHRQNTDNIMFAFTVVDDGVGAAMILPPRWASDTLVDVLSWRAQGVVGGTCPRCHATSFVLDERRQFIEMPQEAILIALDHQPDCPVQSGLGYRRIGSPTRRGSSGSMSTIVRARF